MEHDQPKTFADTEHVHSGNLTLGDLVYKKDGIQVSFKDKNRRFYVLRCYGGKFLTLSGYKNIKEFKAPPGGHHKTVEQISVPHTATINQMVIPAKKHKVSHVIGIFQDKDMKYLETESSDDLSRWCQAFDDIFVRLGWKVAPPHLSPPPSPLSPPPGSESPDGRVPSRRKSKPPLSRVSVTEVFQTQTRQGPDSCQSRYSSPLAETSNRRSAGGGGQAAAFNFDRPRSTEAGSGAVAHSSSDYPGQRYVNVPNTSTQYDRLDNAHHWHAPQERVVKVTDVRYVNLRARQDQEEPVHPEPPPSLPPRHRRGNTFPGSHAPSEPSSETSPGDCEDAYRPSRAGSEPAPPARAPAPKISLTEADPLSPLANKRFHHLLDDSDVGRKVSLPQLLNSKPRRLGVVVPPVLTPPDSPAMLRKAESYNNVSVDLSKRPLPSPVLGDSFDAQTLRWEMGHKDGFPVMLQKTEVENALGLVRIADYVWVAGWKAGRSTVAKKLHVGDQLRQINEQIVVEPSVANTLFSTSAKDEILLVIRRLPHAKVRCLQRSSVSESWGLDVEGNRVLNVSKIGPAADANITTRAQGAFSERLCDWIITEIDGEPVSLLSKKDQVKNRMDSAGLRMALVIQPDDFIKRLNAELQKVKFAHEYFVGSNCHD